MAKGSTYTELTTPVDTDFLYGEQTSGGPSRIKTAVGAVRDHMFGAMYINEGVTAQTLNATPGTFDVMTSWNTAQGFNGLSSSGVTPDKVNNKITVVNPGYYHVDLHVSFSGTNSSEMVIRVYWNGVAQNHITVTRKLGTGGDVGSTATSGFIDVTTGNTDVDIRISADGASDSITVVDANLNLFFVART